MIIVHEARQKWQQLYARHAAAWSVAPFVAAEAPTLNLKPPSDTEATGNHQAVAEWISGWSQVSVPGLEVLWEVRRWRNSGTQRIPVRLRATSPAALARFTRQHGHWMRLSTRAAELRSLARLEASPSVDAVIQKQIRRVAELEDTDYRRLTAALRWLIEHPDSGLLPRQLPIHGMDSKWFEKHQKLALALLTGLTGAVHTGLRTPPRLYRVRFLDGALAPAGLGDLSAPLPELASLSLSPRHILVVENLQTLLSLPDLPGTVALHGAGYDVRWINDLPWATEHTVHYWGDLDVDGLLILAALRSSRSRVVSLLMDLETLDAHHDLVVPDPSSTAVSAPKQLTDVEAAVFHRLCDSGRLRLEQERIDWGYALNRLRSALGPAARDTPQATDTER